MAVIALADATLDPAIDGVLPVSDSLRPGQPAVQRWDGPVSFAFPDQLPAYALADGTDQSLRTASPAERALVGRLLLGQALDGQQSALMGVADFTGLSVLPWSDGRAASADLRIFHLGSVTESAAWAYLPDGTTAGARPESGDVWLTDLLTAPGLGERGTILEGTYAAFGYAHELGHALGLKHGNEGLRQTAPLTGPDDQGPGVWNPQVPEDRDSHEFTLMTYHSYAGAAAPGAYTNGPGSAPQGFMMLDIAALQHLYGANYAFRAGDTT